MTPRALLTTIGATALAFGTVIGGVATTAPVAAQETTTASRTAQIEQMQQARADAYQSFLGTLASELGVSEADADTAIRAAIKAQIAEGLAAGDLTPEEAAARTAVIDVTEVPLMGISAVGGAFDGGGRFHGPMAGGGRERDGRGDHGFGMMPGADDRDGPMKPGDDADDNATDASMAPSSTTEPATASPDA